MTKFSCEVLAPHFNMGMSVIKDRYARRSEAIRDFRAASRLLAGLDPQLEVDA